MKLVWGSFIVVIMGTAAVMADLLAPATLQYAKVHYARAEELRVFPVPNLVFERAGLATEKERDRLREQLVAPLINASEKPISVVVIEFHSDEPRKLSVTVYWTDGSWDALLVTATEDRFVDYSNYRAQVEALQDDGAGDD